jgi:hypothetical protein
LLIIFLAAVFQILKFLGLGEIPSGSTSPKKRNEVEEIEDLMKNAEDWNEGGEEFGGIGDEKSRP